MSFIEKTKEHMNNHSNKYKFATILLGFIALVVAAKTHSTTANSNSGVLNLDTNDLDRASGLNELRDCWSLPGEFSCYSSQEEAAEAFHDIYG